VLFGFQRAYTGKMNARKAIITAGIPIPRLIPMAKSFVLSGGVELVVGVTEVVAGMTEGESHSGAVIGGCFLR